MSRVGYHFQLSVAPIWRAVFPEIDRLTAPLGARPIATRLRAVTTAGVIGGTVDHRLASGSLRYDVTIYGADGSGHPRVHLHHPCETDVDLRMSFPVDADWSDESIDPDDVPRGVFFDAYKGLCVDSERSREAIAIVPLQAWGVINFIADFETGNVERPEPTGGDAGTRRGFYAPFPCAPGFKVEAYWPEGHYKRTRWRFAADLLDLGVAVTPMVLR